MCAVCSLMVELASYETALPSSRVWVEGDFCVAKYSQDDRWYRGKIEKRAEDNMFEVQHSLICADLWYFSRLCLAGAVGGRVVQTLNSEIKRLQGQIPVLGCNCLPPSQVCVWVYVCVCACVLCA